jgi:polysaccharide export outer membrane protein
MADMKKQTTNVPSIQRRPRWGVALALVIVAASISAAMAQSTLRFVNGSTDATVITPMASAPTATAAQPAQIELRFVEAKESVQPADPASGEASRATPARVASVHGASTLTLVPTKPATSAAVQPNQVSAWDLHFVPLPKQAAPQPVAPARLAAPEIESAATELFFSTPDCNAEAVSQRVVSQPVRALAPTTPAVAPVGTELFANVAPKQWDLPALDYGLALKQLEPPRPLVAVAQPVEPTRVVAKPIVPSMGTELFAAEPPQRPQLPPALELDFSNVRIPEVQPMRVFTAAPPARVTAAAPVATPPEHFVPAATAPLVAAALPTPLESDKPATVTNAEPALLAASTPAPKAKSLFDVTEPAPVNTYKFRFAATTDSSLSSTGSGAAPATLAALSSEPESLLPSDAAAPYGCNAPSCQCDCPYGCGQSGTRMICGVDCGMGGAPCSSTWSDSQCIPWSLFGPGEYVGPARTEHVSTYFLRVNDFITLTFIESRKKSAEHYRIGVGDRLQIEWLQGAANTETPLNRTLLVQPDGTVTLPLIGEVAAAGKTIPDFRDEVVKLYGKFQREPQITVTPISVNVGIQDLLKAVTAKNRSSGQEQDLKVTPEGTIQAAGIGSVYVQGLTLDELKSELEARYAAAYGPGLAVSPALTERATSYVFLGGEVKSPGRYTLEGPTTVMQAIALAGGWNIGGNVRQVVIFRRDENWCLKATKIDVRAPLYGQDPCPVNDVWLRENDLVIVPKSRILCATDVINLYFTRGVYAVFPINYVYDFSQSSGIVPVP